MKSNGYLEMVKWYEEKKKSYFPPAEGSIYEQIGKPTMLGTKAKLKIDDVVGGSAIGPASSPSITSSTGFA